MKNKLSLIKILLIYLLILTVLSAWAGSNETVFAAGPDAIVPPKWTRTLPANSCPGASDTNCHWGSPVLAHIDGDNKLDIVAVTNKGFVIAVRHDNTLLWQKDMAPHFNMQAGKQEIASSPAVADIDQDGFPEIAVGVGTNFASHCTKGGLVVLNHDGSLKWRFISTDENDDGCPDTIFSSPALADLNNDGFMEVIAGGFDRRIHAWDHNGNHLEGFPPPSEHSLRFPTWPNLRVMLVDTVWGSPAVVDLTGNGQLDILIGTDEGDFGPSWGGDANGWTCPYAAPDYCGGSVYGLTYEGQLLKHYDPQYEFPRRFLEHIQSTPAIADVNNDGYPEIFVGTGSYYYANSPDHPTISFRLFGMDRFGRDLPGWEGGKYLNGPTPASPAIGDIDGDGDLEIVMGSMNNRQLHAFHANGQKVNGFPTVPVAQNGMPMASYNVGASFVLADYDNDPNNDMEIFISQGWGVAIIDGDGDQLTMTNFPNDNRPLYLTSGSLINVPAVGDIDNDNKLELVVSNSELVVWDLDTSSNNADWPMFKRDAPGISAFPPPPSMLAAPNSLTAYHQAGQGGTAQTSIIIRNTGGAPIEWDIDTPEDVTAVPSSGTLPVGGMAFVTINIPVSGGAQPDTYNMGDLTVTATSDQGSVLGSGAAIPVQLVVGDISNSYIPIVQK